MSRSVDEIRRDAEASLKRYNELMLDANVLEQRAELAQDPFAREMGRQEVCRQRQIASQFEAIARADLDELAKAVEAQRQMEREKRERDDLEPDIER